MSIDHHVFPLAGWQPYPPPELTAELAIIDSDVVAMLGGELDADTACQLTTLVGKVLRQVEVRRLVLDMAGVRFFCAAGITALIGARRAVAERGAVLVLRNPTPIVRRVLAITGDHQWFTMNDASA